MNNFQRITASREALATFLGTIPAIETPWDDAFHRIYCSSCSAADCDDCRRPERDSPLHEGTPPLADGLAFDADGNIITAPHTPRGAPK